MSDCRCIPCDFCGGTEYCWFNLMGDPKKRREDDLDELGDCPYCDDGIIEECDHCLGQFELQQWLEDSEQ